MVSRGIKPLEDKRRLVTLALRKAFRDVIADPDFLGALDDLDPTISELRADLAALERAIRILDPKWVPSSNPVRDARKGGAFPPRTLRPKIMAVLRESDRAWNHIELAEELIRRHKIVGLSPAARNNLVGGIKSHFQRDHARGLVERIEETNSWRFRPKAERTATGSPASASTASAAV